MTIREMQEAVSQTAVAKGFRSRGDVANPKDTMVRLMLLVTEVAEAAQELKRGGFNRKTEFAEELADVGIRLLDIADSCDIDLQYEMVLKNETNKLRPYLYGTTEEAS